MNVRELLLALRDADPELPVVLSVLRDGGEATEDVHVFAHLDDASVQHRCHEEPCFYLSGTDESLIGDPV